MEQGTPLTLVADEPQVDFDGICQKLRAALEPARVHAVSLHDEHGDLLWLSESSMGPDEHNAVRDALEGFANGHEPPVLAFDLGDSRSAVALRTINARRIMVGLVMVIVDTRTISQDERGVTRLVTPKLQRALMDFACMLPERALPVKAQAAREAAAPAARLTPASPNGASKAAPAKPAAPAPLADKAREAGKSMQARRFTQAPKPAQTPASNQTTRSEHAARIAPAPAASRASTGRLELSINSRLPVAGKPAALHDFELSLESDTPPPVRKAEKQPAPVSPEIDRLHSELRRSPIALHVQRLVPLTKGNQARRYEVLLRSKAEPMPTSAPQDMLQAAVKAGLGSMLDRRVFTALIGWLVRNRGAWQDQSTLFTVNLTTTALHDEHFLKFVELCLAKSSLPGNTIGFEIDVPTALRPGINMGAIAAALHRMHCPLVLDDFALRTECIDLLRLPGVRLIKLAPSVTTRMRTDKLAQAAITAMVQMARVLGMHTVAKHVNSAKEQEWLTALGVDFIQSNTVAPAAAIESLAPRDEDRR